MATYSYRCEAKSIDAFLAQLCRYISSGHYFYITARVPDGKDPRAVDEELIKRYSIARPKWKRQRRNLRENSGIHYLRYKSFFVICLTKGRHESFFGDHGRHVRDIRHCALKFCGYSVCYSYSALHERWKVNIRLDKETYRTLKAHLVELGTRPRYRDASRLEEVLRQLPYQGYEPVVRRSAKSLFKDWFDRLEGGKKPGVFLPVVFCLVSPGGEEVFASEPFHLMRVADEVVGTANV